MEKFKNLKTRIYVRFGVLWSNFTRYFNSIRGEFILWNQTVEYRRLFREFIFWIMNVVSEGVVINFAVHYLFNLSMNVFTVFAYGILIDKTINFYHKLRGK